VGLERPIRRDDFVDDLQDDDAYRPLSIEGCDVTLERIDRVRLVRIWWGTGGNWAVRLELRAGC